jgi:hypothetical protein
MEAMIPAILARRGAAKLTAIDITLAHKKRIDQVTKSLSFDLELISPLYLSHAPQHFKNAGRKAFDLVVLSGVLYHVFDVMNTIASARALVRTGGIVITEAWLSKDFEALARFNDHGRFTDEVHTFWFVSIGALDYLLRFFGLQPLDCVYLNAPTGTIRLAVTCRAHDHPVAGDDLWMRDAAEGGPDAHLAKMMRLESKRNDAVPVKNETENFSIVDYVRAKPPETVSERDVTLWLADKF